MWTRNGSSTEDNSPLRATNLSLQSTFVRARNRPQFCMELWLAGQWSTCTSDEAVVRWKCTRDLSKRFLTNPCSRKFTAGGLKEIPYEDSTLLHGAVRQDSAKRHGTKMSLRENAEIIPKRHGRKSSDFEGWSTEKEVTKPNLQWTAVTEQNVHQKKKTFFLGVYTSKSFYHCGS